MKTIVAAYKKNKKIHIWDTVCSYNKSMLDSFSGSHFQTLCYPATWKKKKKDIPGIECLDSGEKKKKKEQMSLNVFKTGMGCKMCTHILIYVVSFHGGLSTSAGGCGMYPQMINGGPLSNLALNQICCVWPRRFTEGLFCWAFFFFHRTLCCWKRIDPGLAKSCWVTLQKRLSNQNLADPLWHFLRKAHKRVCSATMPRKRDAVLRHFQCRMRFRTSALRRRDEKSTFTRPLGCSSTEKYMTNFKMQKRSDLSYVEVESENLYSRSVLVTRHRPKYEKNPIWSEWSMLSAWIALYLDFMLTKPYSLITFKRIRG